MDEQPLLIHSWPSCIIHLDADAFFASVEQAVDPKLKGKPVITGAERGIIAAASYEAKKMGIQRGVRISEAKKICPNLICLPSDYETYSIFSKRMFEIMRRFTPVVEEYSIDEAFADLQGLRQLHRTSYGEIGKRMKEAVERELGITVSVGVSLTKSLAKLASKLKKPSGLVIVSGRYIHKLLEITALSKVWGFGPNKVAFLEKLGIKNALDFVKKDEGFAKRYLAKPGLEIFRELSGQVAWPVTTAEKSTYFSISKTKTFTPPSKEKSFVFAQALRNLEAAFMKARRYSLSTKKVSLYLKRQDFEGTGLEIHLPNATSTPLDMTSTFSEMFNSLYKPNILYRATGVVLGDLAIVNEKQFSLFENPFHSLKNTLVTESIDEINSKYGKHKIHLAESLPAQKRHEGVRGELPARKKTLLAGENFRQRLGITLLRHEV